jgi:hypothetical protein
MIRISDDILIKLRTILPEFKDESDANLVRVALRKFIYEKQSIMPDPKYERQMMTMLEEIRKKIEAKSNQKQKQ